MRLCGLVQLGLMTAVVRTELLVETALIAGIAALVALVAALVASVNLNVAWGVAF